MAAGKEQRNNEREPWWGETPEWPSQVRRGSGLARRADGLVPLQLPSRAPVCAICLGREPRNRVVYPGWRYRGAGSSVEHGSAGAMAQHLTQTKKARSPANLFRPFGSLALLWCCQATQRVLEVFHLL